MLVPGILLLSFVSGDEKPAKDYLNIGRKITFSTKEYHLAWSSHPSKEYYKQEYLPEGSDPENYHDMIMVEAIHAAISPEDALRVKIAELQELKKTIPMINWNVYSKDDERILDFVISDGGAIYEWNLYRYYKQFDEKDSYLLLCAYSYKDNLMANDDLKPFFERISVNRDNYITELGNTKLPSISPRK